MNDTLPQSADPQIDAEIPLKKLREVAGLTQEQMAERLTIPVANIRAIEGGRRSVNKETAFKAQAQFGVFAESLLGKSKEPITLLGERVSQESLWRAVVDTGMQKITDDDIKTFTQPLTFLLKAAAYKGKALPLVVCYRTMLRELAEMLGLSGAASEEAYQFYKRRSYKEYSVKELRADPKLADAVGFEDAPELPDSATWKLKGEVDRKWRDWLFTLEKHLQYHNVVDSDGNSRYRDLSKDPHPYPFVPKGYYELSPPKN